jgi:hypothetical protein
VGDYKALFPGKIHLAQVELNKKQGCIDLQGKEIIPVKQDDMFFLGPLRKCGSFFIIFF